MSVRSYTNILFHKTDRLSTYSRRQVSNTRRKVLWNLPSCITVHSNVYTNTPQSPLSRLFYHHTSWSYTRNICFNVNQLFVALTYSFSCPTSMTSSFITSPSLDSSSEVTWSMSQSSICFEDSDWSSVLSGEGDSWKYGHGLLKLWNV